ncbi:MAG: alkaline phosphatase [Muribaculaceae bacterium]|nr:alkaline phosphatase [Muribaculaceae bacterium]
MNFKHLLAGAALMAACTAVAQQPRYIFYYIGDGMGMGPVTAAQTYNRTILGSDKPLTMMQFPVAGISLTYSANADITDSAAAGTALSTGNKTKNGMLGMNPDSVSVTSIASRLHDMGYGVGVTTSVAADDATPGAFYAHVPYRKMYYDIDRQLIQSGYEFVAGAGLGGMVVDGDTTDIASRLADAKVQLVRGPEQIASINSERVVLLNPEGTPAYNIGYTIDSIAGVLTLPQIAETCLAHLERTSPDRFFMMVEGGNIDHALHGNDGGAAIKEVLNFDQALAVAYNFYLAHPDETLIIVTADHDTGGMVHVHPRGAMGGLRNIDFQRVSKEEFSAFCKGILRSRRMYTWEDMKEYLEENLGFYTHIKVTDQQTEDLKALFDRTFEQRNSADQQTLYASFNEFAVEVFRIFNDATGLAFTSTGHSGNPVPVFAVGVGADEFRSLNNNTDIPAAIMRLIEESGK